MLYVTSLFKVLPQSVSMEAIAEVETLPRAASSSSSYSARVTSEEHYQIQTQQRYSQQRLTQGVIGTAKWARGHCCCC
uniref:Secreted protein n=1 Tax=Knipowitschia caucasica TaxID=637954 RepID=A0AAV2LFN9_KNICA